MISRLISAPFLGQARLPQCFFLVQAQDVGLNFYSLMVFAPSDYALEPIQIPYISVESGGLSSSLRCIKSHCNCTTSRHEASWAHWLRTARNHQVPPPRCRQRRFGRPSRATTEPSKLHRTNQPGTEPTIIKAEEGILQPSTWNNLL